MGRAPKLYTDNTAYGRKSFKRAPRVIRIFMSRCVRFVRGAMRNCNFIGFILRIDEASFAAR
jgi:hypothetical protein